jgi:hypothetical protein
MVRRQDALLDLIYGAIIDRFSKMEIFGASAGHFWHFQLPITMKCTRGGES